MRSIVVTLALLVTAAVSWSVGTATASTVERRHAVVVCKHAITEDAAFRIRPGSDWPNEMVLQCIPNWW